jgi:hypothetical protein
MHDRGVFVDHLVSEIALGRIRSVAFVVESDVSATLPLYGVAIETARRGWTIGIEDVRYWLVTPEPEPLAGLGTAASVAASQRLEPEGIAFVGSTYPDVRHGVVLLDPQGDSIEVDVVVSLGHDGVLRAGRRGSARVSSHELPTDRRSREPVRIAALAAPAG